jgi:hypothetical protein
MPDWGNAGSNPGNCHPIPHLSSPLKGEGREGGRLR